MRMRTNKAPERLLQIFIVVFLFGTVLLCVQKTGLISYMGHEDVHWERARFLLGQGGASQYDGSSLISVGYSLILLPVCALVRSPYAAYKVAVLLNGVFLCGSYFAAFLTAKKLFPGEKTGVLAAAGLFSVLCPVLGAERYFTGPGLMALFLIWVSLYLLLGLQERYEGGRAAALAVCIILLPFLEAGLLGAAAALTVTAAVLIRRRAAQETSFLKFLLAVLIGLAAGNIVERVILSHFCAGTDIVWTSSLEVLFAGIGEGWKNGYLIGLFNGIAGKLYAAITASFFFVCPGVLFLTQNIYRQYKQKRSCAKETVLDGVFCIFLFQLLVISLYDNSRSAGMGLASLEHLGLVLSPVILIGMIYLKNSLHWEREMTGYLLLLCVCTFAVVTVYQANEVESISKVNNGILMLFSSVSSSPVSMAYMAGCAVMLLGILGFGCLKWKPGSRFMDMALKAAGILILVVFCGGADTLVFRNTAQRYNANHMEQIAPVASLISESGISGEQYYLLSGGETRDAVILQSLMPKNAVRLVKASDQAEFLATELEEVGDPVVYTGTGASLIESLAREELEDYRLLYMTESIAVWAKRDSETCIRLDEAILSRLEYMQWSATEKKSGTGAEETVLKSNTLLLAPGTYRVEIALAGGASQTLDGKITVSEDGSTITTSSFEDVALDENGSAAVAIEFTGSDVMREVQVKLEGSAAVNADVRRIYCRKLTSAYTAGINKSSAVWETCEVIRELDEACETIGTVAYVEGTLDAGEVSARCFETYLPDYTVSVVGSGELPAVNADYLIGTTTSHSYFAAMEDYSIFMRGSSYTILVRNDSPQYRFCQESGEGLSSEGREIFISAISGKSAESTEKITLEAGTYRYHVNVSWEPENISGGWEDAAGTLYLYYGDEVLAERTITNSELLENASGEAEFILPLALRTKHSGIVCQIEPAGKQKLEVTPKSVELVSEKYQFGWEEDLQELFDVIDRLGEDVTVSVTQQSSTVYGGLHEYSYLQDQIPESEVRAITYDEAFAMTEDTILMTRGFSANFMRLLNYYSIIGQAGQYTLWAYNNGQLLERAISEGIVVHNSGEKVSLSTIAAASGNPEQEDVIASLPKAAYTITLELEASELAADDTVEVELLCNKTQDEIDEEVEDLLGRGYTEEEALEEIDPQKVCGSGTYTASQFNESGTLVKRINTSDRELENLTVRLYSWYGGEVKGKIVWVEIA